MPSSLFGWTGENWSGSTSQQTQTADWIARQLTEAFPWSEAPRYLVRDRDQVYGTIVTRDCAPWVFGTSLSRRPHLGRMAFPNGRSDRSGANVWIISSSGAKPICVGFCKPTPAITTPSERTGHWTKMRRSLAPFSGSDQ